METTGSAGRDWIVRRADADDHVAVLGVLDGAALRTDADAIHGAIERDAVLVAEPTAVSAGTTPVGVLVLDVDEITHVAVRRRRRGRGIGTALVAAAAADRESLRAEFRGAVRPFYEALGFDVEPVADADDRYVGRVDSDQRFDEVATGGE